MRYIPNRCLLFLLPAFSFGMRYIPNRCLLFLSFSALDLSACGIFLTAACFLLPAFSFYFGVRNPDPLSAFSFPFFFLFFGMRNPDSLSAFSLFLGAGFKCI